jgi:hypothetical protein
MRRRWRLWLSLALLFAGVGVCLHPNVYWPVYGWWRGEQFYGGLPTSGWRAEAEGLEEIWPDSYPVGGIPEMDQWARPYPWWRTFLKEYANVKIECAADTDIALLRGDPAATSVLLVLLRDPDYHVRRFAVYGLARIASKGGELQEAREALQEASEDSNMEVAGWATATMKVLDPTWESLGGKNE